MVECAGALAGPVAAAVDRGVFFWVDGVLEWTHGNGLGLRSLRVSPLVHARPTRSLARTHLGFPLAQCPPSHASFLCVEESERRAAVSGLGDGDLDPDSSRKPIL